MIYELSRKVQSRIEKIILYKDKNFGAGQTQDYIGGLYDSFDILTDNPYMGRRYDDRRRRYIYRSHQVYYRILKGKILIVDIRSNRQSPPA